LRSIANLDERYNVVGRLQTMFSGADTAQVIAGGILGFGEFLVTSVFETFTVIVMTLYFLSSLPSIRSATLRFVPASRRSRVALLSDGVLDRMGGYVSGAATVAALAGLAAFLMLGVLQVEFLLPLALLIALTDLIPLVGATIGALVVTIIVFLDSPAKALAAALFFVVYQQFENFIIYPRVMSRSVDVPPMVAVIAALIGAALLGVVGALLAIPLAAGAIYLFREVVQPRQDAA
jgi:predicted PurR-regulated permease PerM